MNVNEERLNSTIDPFLTVETLSEAGSHALGHPVTAKEAKILQGGCWNRVIGVTFENDEPELVYKISPNVADERLVREYRVLTEFARTEMPVPEPLHLDPSGQPIPGTLLVMSKIPGMVMHRCFGMLPREQRQRITGQIAETVARLHRRRDERFGGVEAAREDRHESWADFWLPRFDAVFEDISSKDLLAASFVDRVAAARTRFEPALAIGAQSTFTHYDIWSGNVMIDIRDGEAVVSGYIDIPGYWADYARELSFAEMFGVADGRFYEVYEANHSLDAGFELRKSIYNLKMHMKHITMYPDQGYYRQGAEECLRYVEHNT